MGLQFEISKRLSKEHQEVMALLARLESFLRSCPVETQPDWRGPGARRIMGDLKAALAAEIPHHFAIEERELFPLYAQDGGDELVAMLLADHQLILGLVREVQPLVEKVLRAPDEFGQGEWETLRAKGNVLATELAAHADKEEFGFVPAMDERMDPETARRILARYLELQVEG